MLAPDAVLRDAGYWSRCQPAVKKKTTVVTVLYVGVWKRCALCALAECSTESVPKYFFPSPVFFSSVAYYTRTIRHNTTTVLFPTILVPLPLFKGDC